MQAIVKTKPDVGLELREVPTPEPGPTEILIRVQAAAICGSDLPIFDWDDPWTREKVRPGQIVGHEFSGVVVACGSEVNRIPVGALVTAEGHINCGRCLRCADGQGHVCPDLKLIGFDAPGAFAEYIAVPAQNVVVLTGLEVDIAAVQDPFGNAVHAVSRVPVTNSTLLVTGCGPIGLMVIALAAASGARAILVSDPIDYRLELALSMGASVALNPTITPVIPAAVKASSPEVGPDVFFEMSGSAAALQEGFSALRPGGTAVMLGLPRAPITFDFAADLVGKGITVHGIVGRLMYQTWAAAQRYLDNPAAGIPAALARLTTHRLWLSDFERGFELAREKQCGKVLLIPDHDGGQTAEGVPA